MFNEVLYIFLATLTLLSLEYKFSLRKYVFLSYQKREDIIWYLLHQFLYPIIGSLFIFQIGSNLSKVFPSLIDVFNFKDNHIAIQVLIFLVVMDFISYWVHRAFHSFPFLWKLHRVHHSTTELTVLSSFRTNFLDFLLHSLILGLLTGLLQVSDSVRMGVNLFFSFVCIIQHLNIKIPYPEFLESILITPRNHLWHHSVEMHTRYGQNFGFLLVLWDKVFKTLYNPNNYDTKIGLSDSYEYSSSIERFIFPLDRIFKFFFNRS